MPQGRPLGQDRHGSRTGTKPDGIENHIPHAAEPSRNPALMPFIAQGKKNAGKKNPPSKGQGTAPCTHRKTKPTPQHGQTGIFHGMKEICRDGKSNAGQWLMGHGGDKEGVKNGWNDAHPICLMSFLIDGVCPKTKSQPQDQGRQGHQPLQMMRIEKPFDQHPCRKMQGENGGHEVPWTGGLQPAHCCAEKMDGDS